MEKEVVFYELIGFFEKKEDIKEIYDNFAIEQKEIYRMYVYSLPFMKDDIKDLIWEYLNGYEESKFDLSKEYRKAKEKLEKRKKNEMHNTF